MICLYIYQSPWLVEILQINVWGLMHAAVNVCTLFLQLHILITVTDSQLKAEVINYCSFSNCYKSMFVWGRCRRVDLRAHNFLGVLHDLRTSLGRRLNGPARLRGGKNISYSCLPTTTVLKYLWCANCRWYLNYRL